MCVQRSTQKAKAQILPSNTAQNNQTGETACTSITETKRQHNQSKVPSCQGRCVIERKREKKHLEVSLFSVERTPGSLLRKVRVRVSERQFQEVTNLSNEDHLQLTNSRAAFPTGGRALARIFVFQRGLYLEG